MTEILANLAHFSVQEISPGRSGFDATNERGAWVRVPHYPPRFRATVEFEWNGEPPAEIMALIERVRERA